MASSSYLGNINLVLKVLDKVTINCGITRLTFILYVLIML